MSADAFGLLSTAPTMQAFLAALDLAERDADIERFMTVHAVLFTDLSGFSAHPIVAQGLQRIRRMEYALSGALSASGGIVIKSLGDSHLMMFPDVADAVGCVELVWATCPDNPFCVGIGYGQMVVCEYYHGRLDVFGVEVSAASRLGEDVASESQALLTPAAYAQGSPALQRRCVAGMEGGIRYWEFLGERTEAALHKNPEFSPPLCAG